MAVAASRLIIPRVQATGTIRLRPGARIDVGARVSGVVASLLVGQGSRVNAGDVIAQLDTREAEARLASAVARLEELVAVAAQAEEELRILVELAPAGGATPQQILAARTAVATTNARLHAARADRDLDRIQLDYATVRAPIGGVIASVTVHEGETVAASLAAPTFVTIIDPARLECIAFVDETDISRVATGDSVTFTVDAYAASSFRGTVSRIAPDATVIGGVVDYETTVRILAGLTRLRPQMSASVTIEGPARTALVVPATAVRQSSTGNYVWRVQSGAPVRTPVRLGPGQPDAAEIRDGLAAGDTVLTGAFPDSP